MPRLHHVDASFLAGEVDPAIVARLDDVVRANGLAQIRNAYVRSAGGVRVRPGMRLVAQIADRPVALSGGTLSVHQSGTSFSVRDLSEGPAIVPAWPQANEGAVEIDFGQEVAAGSTVVVRLRLEEQTPEGVFPDLYWWEENDANTDEQGDTPPIGKFRSGAGLAPGRDPGLDRFQVRSKVYADFSHTLVGPASKVRLWSRRWAGTRPLAPVAFANALWVVTWYVTRQDERSGLEDAPAARLLDVSWFPDVSTLLALHGAHATVLQDRSGSGQISINPFGFSPETGFSDAQVRTMAASKTPQGALVHSPSLFNLYELEFGVRGGTNLFLELRRKQDLTLPDPDTGWRIGTQPYAWLAHQGRIIAAGTRGKPNGIWFSQALGAPRDKDGVEVAGQAQTNRANFRAPVISQSRQPLASDAFMVEEAGRPLNRILAIHGGLLMVFFGSHGISFLDRAYISATDFGFRENSERGIREGVPPIEIGTGKLAFVDASGNSVWQMTYANERQGYVLNELSQVAPHLLADPEDLVYFDGLPDGGNAVFVVNGDGTVAVCAIQPEGEWNAWSQWSTDRILDLERAGDTLWAMTLRGGESLRRLYVERFDPDVELDFCQVSPDGTHPYADRYETWAAVAIVDNEDGTETRYRIGMDFVEQVVLDEIEELKQRIVQLRADTDPEADHTDEIERLEEREAVLEEQVGDLEDRMLTDDQVRDGLSHLDPKIHVALADLPVMPSEVDRWQVGQPFRWALETMPFVKRTAEGSAFQSPTKTQEVFVNWESDDPRDTNEGRVQPLFYTINGEKVDPTPRVFDRPPVRPVTQLRTRHLNIVGWREENAIRIDGQGALTIDSLSRTVVTQ